MEATLKVIIGISGPLEKLAHKALELLGQGSAHDGARCEATGLLRAPQPIVQTIVEPTPPAPAPQPQEEPPVSVEPEPEPAQELEPQPEEPEPQIEPAQPDEVPPAIPDDETMRTMMDIAISRWAGVGSENSKDPKVLGMRKDVCNSFKQIARHLGAEKPTRLQGDLRNRFLSEIEENLFCEDGRIIWRAF